MGSQIEQLKNRAKEYAKAYHEKESKSGVTETAEMSTL